MAIQRHHWRLLAVVFLVVITVAILALSATHHAFTIRYFAQVLHEELLGLTPNSVWHV